MIVLPLYGLYQNSLETKNKKDLIVNKLENLNDDLSLMKFNVDKETNKILEKLDEMKKKLQIQREILTKNTILQKTQKEKNKVLLSDLNDFLEIQKQDLEIERKNFDSLISSLNLNNPN